MTAAAPAPDPKYLIYVRNSPDAQELPQPQPNRYLGIACARARHLSTHPLPALRPFYVAVYAADEARPVEAYQNGMKMSDAGFEAAFNTPFVVREPARVLQTAPGANGKTLYAPDFPPLRSV